MHLVITRGLVQKPIYKKHFYVCTRKQFMITLRPLVQYVLELFQSTILRFDRVPSTLFNRDAINLLQPILLLLDGCRDGLDCTSCTTTRSTFVTCLTFATCSTLNSLPWTQLYCVSLVTFYRHEKSHVLCTLHLVEPK